MIVFSLATWKKSSLSVILQTTITCPQCGGKAGAEMPQNACQWFYDCAFCGTLLRPKKGDCCVFCSYAKHQCPPMQKGGSC
ncbi:MAG: hypothetical protein HAW59_00410, partial [Betaproteobacteria bacterium]|nr:hypothetical protein [Betaproteobacteria bacterium]